MKRKYIPCVILLACVCMAGACSPSEESVAPKRPSSRDENLKRYLPKGQELRSQIQLRAKPIVSGPLVAAARLKELSTEKPLPDIAAYLTEAEENLQQTIRTESAQAAAQKVQQQLAAVSEELQTAAVTAPSSQELAQQLRSFAKRYQNTLNTLADETAQETWALPNAEQSRGAREELRVGGQKLVEQIKDDYGAVCAQKAIPVLEKAGDDYWLALSSVKNPDELKQTLEKIRQNAQESLSKIVTEYGDEQVALTPEQVGSLRAGLIESHQGVEQQFEKLYGKDAVLKARDIFEPYLAGVDAVAAAPGRMSEKTTQLEKLGEDYRSQIAQLQVQLNGALEEKLKALAETEKQPQ